MTHSTTEHSNHPRHLPRPIIKKLHWPVLLIWLIPLSAAILAAYYFYDRNSDFGPTITVQFHDASGLKIGESKVAHLGIQIGLVTDLRLTDDKKLVSVRIRLRRAETAFANQCSQFWIVRPEFSTQEISGLGTVFSGPIIDALPGAGQPQSDFTGLDRAPAPEIDGLSIILKTPHLEALRPDSPIYFRGIQVGAVREIQLSDDATIVEIHAVIQRHYAPLVRTDSQFWTVSALDLKGGLFSGVQMKVESLRSLISGGITFATPDNKFGEPAPDGAAFPLYDEPKKEWLTWSPKISIEPNPAQRAAQNPAPATSGPK